MNPWIAYFLGLGTPLILLFIVCCVHDLFYYPKYWWDHRRDHPCPPMKDYQ